MHGMEAKPDESSAYHVSVSTLMHMLQSLDDLRDEGLDCPLGETGPFVASDRIHERPSPGDMRHDQFQDGLVPFRARHQKGCFARQYERVV